LQTVLMLVIVVVISIAALIPGQTHVALGAELLVIAVGYSAGLVLTSRRSMPARDEPRAWLIGRLVVLGIGAIPLLAGAMSLLVETGGGLYWIAAEIGGAIGGGVTNAWVLLVEIQR
jgi:hypothetical protein